jgi:hypothetical protein
MSTKLFRTAVRVREDDGFKANSLNIVLLAHEAVAKARSTLG